MTQAPLVAKDVIQPYEANPRYWQYKGRPVVLLGGSKTDHIFLLDDLREHLDELHAVGGNYVRNTMSQREAKELKPFELRPDGRFDLDRWNQAYWTRFENMLRWTAEREIFVQIEVWDRFDYSRDNWDHSPWNPGINVNYTYEETGFAQGYPDHPSADRHPFFHSIPGMEEYDPRYDLFRRYQDAFVAKMLSYTLDYGHVLYCMNNETTTHPAWGEYWIRMIQREAGKRGVPVYTTDMFDNMWQEDERQSEYAADLFARPELYNFIDISQVNSRNFDEVHWQRMRRLVERASEHPRPVNNTKIYGDGYLSFGSGGPKDGVARFWRNLIGGCAAVRHHRDGAGIGLQPPAKACIQAARKLADLIDLWDVTSHMELLSNREENQAYLAAHPGCAYVLYFTDGGSVTVDLSACDGTLALVWISIETGAFGPGEEIAAGLATIAAPGTNGWAAAIYCPAYNAGVRA